MAIAPRLDLRQSQQLVMTPQLQQAIKLLQLSNMDLEEFVQQEIESNPLLDDREPDSEPVSGEHRNEEADKRDSSDTVEQVEGAPDGLIETDIGMNKSIEIEGGEVTELDASVSEDLFHHDSASDMPAPPAGEMLGYNGLGSVSGRGPVSPDFNFQDRLQTATSLREHLASQLMMTAVGDSERLIASSLIDQLDEAGYLSESSEVIADRIGAEAEEVEAIVLRLQGYDPPGVFARDLKECLMLQLKELNRLDPCMAALLDNLELVARRDYRALMRHCRVDADDLADMVSELQALNPKPGLALSGDEPVQSIIPDVFVRKNPKGVWTVELNSETLPKVLVNTQYYAELRSLAGEKKDRAFLSECLHNATWLVKALDQRARTIVKVTSELVRQQVGFFEHGLSHLKPLNLKSIADAIEMHESTVSRVTANKYVGTERGIFELKYFFTSAISSSDGGSEHASETVRFRIKSLIEAECVDAILSDDKIVDLLNNEGIDIARRTVAKYREAMGIPSSVQRRREKRLMQQVRAPN